ncbi:hypothetical protein, partial [Escherichia coli]|nr:hypothetical protein [Escherichia coli]
APEVTRKRLWLETVEKVLAENRKVIGGDGRQLIYVPMPDNRAGAAAGNSGTPLVTPEVMMPSLPASTPVDGVRNAERPTTRPTTR